MVCALPDKLAGLLADFEMQNPLRRQSTEEAAHLDAQVANPSFRKHPQ
jgi:hypothetical protein